MMKKYFLAAAMALGVLAGPAMGGASAQVFYRGGPTVLDRLVGNGYGNYGGYGGYGAYPSYGVNPGAYGNYNFYGNRWPRGHCHRRFANYGYSPNYGNYGNPWRHHHHRW